MTLDKTLPLKHPSTVTFLPEQADKVVLLRDDGQRPFDSEGITTLAPQRDTAFVVLLLLQLTLALRIVPTNVSILNVSLSSAQK